MYTVFGYTDDCKDFSQKFDSFVEAAKAYRELAKWCVVFIRRDVVRSCMFLSNRY